MISRSHSRSGVLALAASAGLAVALLAPAVHAAPSARAAKTAKPTKCDISKVATDLGTTEVTSLSVTKTTCDKGIKVVRAFHQCRLTHGPSGRCVKLVKEYACGERRTNGPTQFTAKATCSKGDKRVVHSYTQIL